MEFLQLIYYWEILGKIADMDYQIDQTIQNYYMV
jgi:hypothetical protein